MLQQAGRQDSKNQSQPKQGRHCHLWAQRTKLEAEPWKPDENWEEAKHLGAVRTLLLVSGCSGCFGASVHNSLSICGLFATKNASPLKNSLILLVTALLGLKLGATGLIWAERPLLLITI